MNNRESVFTKYRRVLVRIVGAVLLLGLVVYLWNRPGPVKVIQLDPITTTIEVPVEKLVEKTVTKYIKTEDRAGVASVFAENQRLNAEVSRLTVALAEHTSTGGGPVTQRPPSIPETPTATAPAPTLLFQDWRLRFESDGTRASYTLKQRFSILTSVGTNRQNVPVAVVKLYEIDDQEHRKEIPITESTTIAATPNPHAFYVAPTIQAGVGLLPSGTQTVVVAMPWLKRGSARAVEHTRYAFLTPAVSATKQDVTISVLPVSVNLGTLKYTPFTDIWASPLITVNPKTNTTRIGFAATTTF